MMPIYNLMFRVRPAREVASSSYGGAPRDLQPERQISTESTRPKIEHILKGKKKIKGKTSISVEPSAIFSGLHSPSE